MAAMARGEERCAPCIPAEEAAPTPMETEVEGAPENEEGEADQPMEKRVAISLKRSSTSAAPAFDASKEDRREFIPRKKMKLANLEDMKESVPILDPTEIAKLIPRDDKEVLDFKIDWNLMRKKNILEEKMRPWISKKLEEFLGEEDKVTVDIILREVGSGTGGAKLQKTLAPVFDEAASPFVIKLWRMLIFFFLQYRHQV